MTEFLMPSLGADMEAGTLVEWIKKPGDRVNRGDIIAEVDTQKGLIEIEVFDEGVITELLIKEGTKVPVGTIMALIEQKESVETKKETAPEPAELQPAEERLAPAVQELKAEDRKIKASPLARRIAAENNIDLSQITGTGENGAISREDVEKVIARQKEPTTAEISQSGITERSGSQLESIRAAIAAAMSRSNREIPHYYLEKSVDMTKALEWLRDANSRRTVRERLLPVALLIKAAAQSLTEVPELNAYWENKLLLKKEINIGFVVSLRSGGLLIPGIRQADLKSTDEIMQALNDIIPRARSLKLRSSDLSDSTITITNIGEGGAETIFGVIYPPQVAIIGFGSILEQPFAEKGMMGIRPVLQVTLAGDHRATDGLTGSRFLTVLNKHLQNPELL